MSKRDMEFVQHHRPNVRMDFNIKRRVFDRFQILVPCWPENGDYICGHGSTANCAWRTARKTVERDLAHEAKVDTVRMPLDRWFDYAHPLGIEGNLDARRIYFAGLLAASLFCDEAESLSLLQPNDLFSRWVAGLKAESEREE